MNDNGNGQSKEEKDVLPESFILIQFDKMGSTAMTIQVGGVVPSQMKIASWYLDKQAEVGLLSQMEQMARAEQAKHIAIPTAKH